MAQGLDALSLEHPPMPLSLPFVNGISPSQPLRSPAASLATASATSFGSGQPAHNSRALDLDNSYYTSGGGGGAAPEGSSAMRSRLRSSSANRAAFADAEPALFDGGPVGSRPRAPSPETQRRSAFLGSAAAGDPVSNGTRQSRAALKKNDQNTAERTPGIQYTSSCLVSCDLRLKSSVHWCM